MAEVVSILYTFFPYIIDMNRRVISDEFQVVKLIMGIYLIGALI